MAVRVLRRCRRSSVVIALRFLAFTLFLLALLYLVADHDNPLWLALRFNAHRAMHRIAGSLASVGLVGGSSGSGGNSEWPSYEAELAEFPLDWAADVAIILKTGYGTQERAEAWMRALPVDRDPQNMLVIGDFEKRLVVAEGVEASSGSGSISGSVGGDGNINSGKAEALEFRIHDVIADVLRQDHDTPLGPQKMVASRRAEMYRTLSAAIAAGEDEMARNLSASFGWELDAMKFIPGLDLAYRTMPRKKWFILVDDDTYLIQPSMEAVLSRLDPARPYYLGNAVGDYRQRFAHGGSSVVLSHAAMQKLFATDGPRSATAAARQSLAAARYASLTEVWGDRLLASALLRVGIYIDEDSSRFFNGEQPWAARLRKDRFCVPLTTFHRLSVREMEDVGRLFGRRAKGKGRGRGRSGRDHAQVPELGAAAAAVGVGKMIMWVDLWDIYGAPPFELFESRPLRREWDHVGPLDEHTTTIEHVQAAEACLRRCEVDGACLAWTWEEGRAVCHLSPWITVGREALGKVSGLHARRVTELAGACR